MRRAGQGMATPSGCHGTVQCCETYLPLDRACLCLALCQTLQHRLILLNSLYIFSPTSLYHVQQSTENILVGLLLHVDMSVLR